MKQCLFSAALALTATLFLATALSGQSQSSATRAEREAQRVSGELPAGATMIIRTTDAIDSDRHEVGDTFRASVDNDVTYDGRILVPRGSDATLKLVEDKRSGKISGRAELTLQLVSVRVRGREIPVDSYDVIQTSGSQGKNTAGKAAGGAALGAVIGAIAGGGKGAAIGAAAGAGAGVASQVFTKGQRVKIPSETRLTFTLQNPVRI